MSHELSEGTELKGLVTLPGEDGQQIVFRVGINNNPYTVDCERIVVSEEVGQMAMVPWARCRTKSGEVHLINLANVESVLLPEEP